jgi:putative transposase
MYTFFDRTYFFTATILNWQALLADDRMKQILVNSLEYMSKSRVDIYGFVIMPNHIHLLLRLRNDTVANFQRDFLKYTAQRCLQILRNVNDPVLKNYESTQADRKYQIWERRPYWTEVNRQDIFDIKLAYIHRNPVSGKWCLCAMPSEYKWSSCSFYELNVTTFIFLRNFYSMISWWLVKNTNHNAKNERRGGGKVVGEGIF